MGSLYRLPLTQGGAQKFLEADGLFQEPIEAAGMFAALLHLKERQAHTRFDRLIHETLPLFRSHPDQGQEKLEEMRAQVEGMNIEGFVLALLDADIVLVSEGVIKERRWLAPDGNYSFDFQGSFNTSCEDYEVSFYEQDSDEEDEGGDEFEDEVALARSSRRVVRLSGTRDQSVIARMVASAPDERIAVDAYAGTGKTFLVHALREHLPGGFTYVAPKAHQGHAFNSHIAAGSTLRFVTLNGLADQLARSHARDAGLQMIPKTGPSEYSLGEQARMAGVGDIGKASAEAVMPKLYWAIRSWCMSEDSDLSDRHFRSVGIYNRQELPLYISAANRLWKAMFSKAPKGGRAFDLWDTQIAKWLELKGATIAAQRGTLLVDEAHDLPPAWRRLFDGYQGGCILLGDPHQRLRGKSFRSERSQSARMTTSLRTGVQAADMIERTLRLSAERSMSDFQTAGDHITHLRAYSNPKQLPETGLRLFGNEWAMLEVAQRRAAANAPFRLLTASRETMDKNVRNALALFDRRTLWHGITVNGQRDWESLADMLHKQGLSAIVRMFEHGFDEAKLAKLLAFEAQSEKAPLTLGLIDHSKNQEHDVVALSVCCYEDAAIRRAFDPVHAYYLGMTRARHELWVPGDSLDRIIDLQAAIAH